MKREDFKEIKDEHFEACNEIVSLKGVCANLNCMKCPFSKLNIKQNDCSNYRNQVFCGKEDEKLVESAKEFLKFKEEKMEEKNLFQVGDKVWDIAFGHGIVNEIDTSSEDDFPVSIKYENCNIIWYTKTGIMTLGINRTLFFKEFDIEIPKEALERPKWRAEKGGSFFNVDGAGQVLRMSDFCNAWHNEAFKLGNYFKTEEEAKRSKFYKVFHEED